MSGKLHKSAYNVKQGSAAPLTYTNGIQNDAVVALTGAVQNIAKDAVCYPAAVIGYLARVSDRLV